MRFPVIVLAALLATACAGRNGEESSAPVQRPIVVSDSASGLTAVSAVGARNVRVLFLRPPSIVLLREVFVPDGERITAVRFAGTRDALIVETGAARFALDTHTWRLAQIHRQARGVAVSGRAQRPG